jgi:uncharacterized membrane protein (DUF485 family)
MELNRTSKGQYVRCAPRAAITEAAMEPAFVEQIASNPHYVQLVRDRTRFGWLLTLSMLLVYYGFILLIAFNKVWLATPVGQGVMTIGIPAGLFVIVFTVIVTGIYVRHANGRYDQLAAAIKKECA